MVGAVTTTVIGGYIVLTQDLSHGVEHDDEHHSEKHEDVEEETPAEEESTDDSKDEGMTKTEKANKEQANQQPPEVSDPVRCFTCATS
jgi:recombinational DNA repair protein RecT